MLIREISLRCVNTKIVEITEDMEIGEALIRSTVRIQNRHRPGGGAGVGWWDKSHAQGCRNCKTGRRNSIGSRRRRDVPGDGRDWQAKETEKASFPLVGIASVGLSIKGDPDFVLDPNHTHFILVPRELGDESPRFKIATYCWR
jgi:hypothetical protein